MRTLTAPNVTWQPVQGASTTTVPLQPWLYPKTGFGPRTLYLYFDESGNLDFKSSGTPFFIMTCAVTTRPFNVGRLLTDLRFDLIEHGHPIEKFHACEDVGDVRSAVYDILRALPDSYRVYSACVEKSEVPEEYRTPDAIYSKVFELLVNRVSEREISGRGRGCGTIAADAAQARQGYHSQNRRSRCCAASPAGRSPWTCGCGTTAEKKRPRRRGAAGKGGAAWPVCKICGGWAGRCAPWP